MVTRLCRVFVVAALALSVSASVAGCKDKEKQGANAAAPAPDEGATKAADDLLARRDALMKSRQQIQDEKVRLEQERVRIVESGGDPTELDKQTEELASQEAKIATDESALSDQMQAFLEEVKTVQVIGDTAQQVAAREAATASREKAMASREDRVAQREATIAEREKALALREKETCGVGGGGTTIIQQVDPKGAKYSKRDVEPLLKKAREAMSKKGILASDLPAQAQGLEREATKAMADGDYGPARFAAQQLLATVDSQKVDRGFISAKIARLSSAMKGRKLDDAKQKEVDDLFRDATAKYGDGDYAAANKKLNQIWRAID